MLYSEQPCDLGSSLLEWVLNPAGSSLVWTDRAEALVRGDGQLSRRGRRPAQQLQESNAGPRDCDCKAPKSCLDHQTFCDLWHACKAFLFLLYSYSDKLNNKYIVSLYILVYTVYVKSCKSKKQVIGGICKMILSKIAEVKRQNRKHAHVCDSPCDSVPWGVGFSGVWNAMTY